MRTKDKWRLWRRLSPTFEATLRNISTGRKRSVILRRESLPGIAMTVLRCAKCNWQVWLEAHHRYGNGKPRALPQRLRFDRKKFDRYKKWRTKMLRSKTVCPKCKNDTWRYVRTEVMDHGQVYSVVSE